MGNAPTTFEALLQTMEPLDLDLFHRLKTTRVVSAHAGDVLVAGNRRYRVTDFMCSHEAGASFELHDLEYGDTLIVGNAPTRLPGQPVLVWLPLKLRVEPHTRLGLEFNLCIRCPAQDRGYEVNLLEAGQTSAATAV